MHRSTGTVMIGCNKETTMGLHVAALILPDEIAGELNKMRGRYRRQMQYLTTAHISLYPFSVETDPAAVLEALKSTAVGTKPFCLRLTDVRFFGEPGNAAYVAVEDNPALIDLHADVVGCAQKFAAKVGWRTLYEPGIFTPHATIGEGMAADVLKTVRQKLAGVRLDRQVEIRSFRLFTRCEDGVWRVTHTFPFGQ